MLDNSCHGHSGGTDDFYHYYDIIKLEQGDDEYILQKFSVSAPVSLGLMTDEGACNSPVGGRSSSVGFEDAFKAACSAWEGNSDQPTDVEDGA